MSTTDGDASTELSPDEDERLPILPPRDASTAKEPHDVWNVDGPDDEPDATFEMPEIVPATSPPVDDPTPTAGTPAPAGRVPTVPSVPPAQARASMGSVTTPPGPTGPPGSPGPPTTPIVTTPSTAVPARATAWGDHVGAGAPNSMLRAPGRRPRVRRVTRVLRHIDPWSTFKVALLFSLVAYVVALTSGVLLWRVADSTGTLDNVERWFTQFGWETFELQGGEIFRNAWIIGLFGAVALTGALVLLATLFNLVSDIIGGVRLTVLEEEVVEKTASSARRYVVRRTPAGATAEQWDVDDDADGSATDTAADTAADTPDRPAGSPRTSVANDAWTVDDPDDADQA